MVISLGFVDVRIRNEEMEGFHREKEEKVKWLNEKRFDLMEIDPTPCDSL